MRWRPEGAAKRSQGLVQAGLLSREINLIGVPTPSPRAEGHVAGGAIGEPSADPARSKNPGMHGTSMRKNREIPCPLYHR
jgi:hypothetical protein